MHPMQVKFFSRTANLCALIIDTFCAIPTEISLNKFHNQIFSGRGSSSSPAAAGSSMTSAIIASPPPRNLQERCMSGVQRLEPSGIADFHHLTDPTPATRRPASSTPLSDCFFGRAPSVAAAAAASTDPAGQRVLGANRLLSANRALGGGGGAGAPGGPTNVGLAMALSAKLDTQHRCCCLRRHKPSQLPSAPKYPPTRLA